MSKRNMVLTTKNAAKDEGRSGDKAKEQKFVPPDGGWGWMVVIAFAVNYFVSVPMLQAFGLIFKDTFRKNNMSATDSTTILNVNSALTFGLGLLNGPLLRKFSFRKVGIAGSIFFFIGVMATSFATTLTHFIIAYSVITAAGFCLLSASFSLAINTYFLKKRGRATGLGLAAAGLGPVVMPFLISHLLKEYAVQGTVMVIGALGLHSLMAALLLQPVKWHMKPTPPEEEKEGEDKEDDGDKGGGGKTIANVEDGESTALSGDHHKDMTMTRRQRTNTISSVEHDLDSQSIYGFDTPLVNPSHPERSYDRSVLDVSGGDHRRRYSRSMSQDTQVARTYWWKSTDTINLGSSLKIFEERQHYSQLDKDADSYDNNNLTEEKMKKNDNALKKAMVWVSEFFYLELLKDPIYINIMLGISTAIFAELNFSMLTPFILADFGFSTGEVAMVMSATAGVDIIFRFLVPFVAERFNLHPRVMYLFSLTLLITSRSLLIFLNSLSAVLGIAVFLGVAKGIRTVYMTLVIPTYVPLEKLPGASGIQMMVNGLVFAILGPLLGVLRDYSGSYVTCIYFINAMTFFTLFTWLVEMAISREGFRGYA